MVSNPPFCPTSPHFIVTSPHLRNKKSTSQSAKTPSTTTCTHPPTGILFTKSHPPHQLDPMVPVRKRHPCRDRSIVPVPQQLPALQPTPMGPHGPALGTCPAIGVRRRPSLPVLLSGRGGGPSLPVPLSGHGGGPVYLSCYRGAAEAAQFTCPRAGHSPELASLLLATAHRSGFLKSVHPPCTGGIRATSWPGRSGVSRPAKARSTATRIRVSQAASAGHRA